jgi:hypothetical protein
MLEANPAIRTNARAGRSERLSFFMWNLLFRPTIPAIISLRR